MFSGSESNIKYVAVEIVPRNSFDAKAVECGAFMGIATHTEEFGQNKGTVTTFLTVLLSNTKVSMFNLVEYNILSIKAMVGDNEYHIIATKSEEDQAEALTILKNVLKGMSDAKRLLENDPKGEFIDVDTYTDMPEDILTGNYFGDNKTSTTQQATNKRVYGAGGTTSTTQTHTTHQPPEPPKVLNFRRKGKLPTPDTLAKMREMVVALGNGTLKPLVPPVAPIDKTGVVGASDTTASDATDVTDIYAHYGCFG